MPNWTSDRYRELARECRALAATSAPTERGHLLTLAEGYDAQATLRGYHPSEAPTPVPFRQSLPRPRNVAKFRSEARTRNPAAAKGSRLSPMASSRS